MELHISYEAVNYLINVVYCVTSFENLSQFKYLGMTVINQNLIQEDIKSRSNSGNSCYHSVQNLLSSRLLLKIL
jgi:hypothetical protein